MLTAVFDSTLAYENVGVIRMLRRHLQNAMLSGTVLVPGVLFAQPPGGGPPGGPQGGTRGGPPMEMILIV